FIAAGADELTAAQACILAPLSSDGAIHEGLYEIATAHLSGAPA
ncbi:MAG TPA: AAA family ATPase, partial [Gordonia sp. (in: high G+C Gram-positive bacteria)]|nr:AAA family ATPase [Gordonia sp. (in: high G+C Gram-positive bacteria)]